MIHFSTKIPYKNVPGKLEMQKTLQKQFFPKTQVPELILNSTKILETERELRKDSESRRASS